MKPLPHLIVLGLVALLCACATPEQRESQYALTRIDRSFERVDAFLWWVHTQGYEVPEEARALATRLRREYPPLHRQAVQDVLDWRRGGDKPPKLEERLVELEVMADLTRRFLHE